MFSPRKKLPLVFGIALVAFSLAEGGLSGVLRAPAGSVTDTLVIACFATDFGCDERHSQTITVSTSGASARFDLQDLAHGSYLLIAWQDRNGNGDMEEEELDFYSSDGSEPTQLTPPVAGLEFVLADPQPDTQPDSEPASTPASAAIPVTLAGGWFQGSGAAVQYYDPSTGAWAPSTGSGIRYTFTPDGRYEYSGLLQTTSYGCTSTLFMYHHGRVIVDGRVMMLMPEKEVLRSQDNCNADWNYEKEMEPETRYYMWAIAADQYSEDDQVLELTELYLQQDGTLDFEGEVPEMSTFYREAGSH